MLIQPWSIRMLGALSASQTGIRIDRFRSHKTGVLLTYLAFRSERSHTRADLVDLLWPDSEVEAGQRSLRVALSSLRRQLEPPGVPAGSVIFADRRYAGLNPNAFTTDVEQFRQALAQAVATDDKEAAIAFTLQAVGAYQGELLPGYYEDWILTERSALIDAYLGALGRLVRHHAERGHWETSAEFAWRAMEADPLREASYRTLMRLYVALKRPAEVHSLYDLLTQRLRESLGVSPSRPTRDLVEKLTAGEISHVDIEAPTQEEAPNPAAGSPPEKAPATTSNVEGEIPRFRMPPSLTRFFGREEQITDLLQRLQPEASLSPGSHGGDGRGDRSFTEPAFSDEGNAAGRLITLTGPGGTGKTRLALEVGARLEERYSGGAAFVSLAHLADPRLIAGEIRDALRPASSDPEHPLDDVVEALRARATLLILDNLEQIAESAAYVVRDLLLRLPSLTILVTSRRSLGVKGEREYPLASLTLPETTDPPEQMLRAASIQLFVDRASAVQPDFQLTDHNRADIAALCRHLDGMPLAIELAAARARVLAPAQMLSHLTDRFQLLVNRRAGKDFRHRSLRSTIEWSLQLLPNDARRMFTRLSLFQGGWTLEAAEALCRDSEERGETLDLLEQLRIDSMIQTESGASILRFRMLESLREFGQTQLSPNERQEIADLHAGYFEKYAETVFARMQTPEPSAAFEALDVETDNLRAALNHLLSFEEEGRIRGLRLATRLSAWWYARAAFREGNDWMDRALAAAPQRTSAADRARALHGAGRLAGGRGAIAAARDLFQDSLACAREVGDSFLIAEACTGLAVCLQMLNEQEESERLLQECLDIYRSLGDSWKMAVTLLNLGSVRWQLGALEEARHYYLESLQHSGDLGSDLLCSQNLLNLGGVELSAGALKLARSYAEQGLALAEAIPSPLGIAYAIYTFGRLDCLEGEFDRARTHLSASLQMLDVLGERRLLILVLIALAELAFALQRFGRGVRLIAGALALQKIFQAQFKPTVNSERERERLLAEARAHLTEQEFERLWAEGARQSLDQVLEYARYDSD